TLEVVSKWLELAGALGPVPHIAVRSREAQQIEALIVAAAFEGLHRRLYPSRSRLDEDQKLAKLTEPELKKARRAAVKAALSALNDAPVDPEQVSQVYREALAHVDEL